MLNTSIKGMVIAAIAVLVLAVSSLIGIAIIDQTGDVLKTNSVVNNESMTMVNGTAVASSHDEWVSDTWTLYNDSAQTEACTEDVDYTLDSEQGQVTQITNVSCNTLTWYLDYTYQQDTGVTTTAALFHTGLVIFASFSALIVLVLIGTITIKLVRGQGDGEFK